MNVFNIEVIVVISLIAIVVIILILKWDKITGIKVGRDGISIDLDSARNQFEEQGITVPTEIDRSDLPERDAIILSYSALNEIVLSLAKNRNVVITPQHSTLQVLDILISQKILPFEWGELIRNLYYSGKNVIDQPEARVLTNAGQEYRAFVLSLVNFIRDKLFVYQNPTKEPEQISKRTHVGSSGFLPPNTEKPSAILYATTGSIQGRRFPIDKSIYRIGANPRNDLVIPDDSFVSGNHAYICYDNGNLNLFDDQSTNGTFLNNQRLTTQPLSLRIGDQIKIGGCIFTVE